MKKKPIIFFVGQRFVVECAIRSNADCPSKDFIDSLNNQDKPKIIRTIKRYANFGTIFNKEQFKKVEGTEFFEFKSFQIRIFMYHCSLGRIALTHGFNKKGDRIPPGEIERAYLIREEYDLTRRGWNHGSENSVR
jgi:hypothetical protein